MWHGPPLADFRYEPWAQAEIGRLEELRLAAVEERVEADLALGRHTELVGELESLVASHPLRERLRAGLMLALYRSGRQSEALNAYQDARRVLVEEFGIDPSRDLQELERQMLRQDSALDLESATSSAAAPAAPQARSILVLAADPTSSRLAVAVAGSLARSKVPHELILARLVAATPGSARRAPRRDGRAPGNCALRWQRTVSRRGLPRSPRRRRARTPSVWPRSSPWTCCWSEREPSELREGGFDPDLLAILDGAPCDVAVFLESRRHRAQPQATRLPSPSAAASTTGRRSSWPRGSRARPTPRCGSSAWPPTPRAERRDSSRLLATASLAVQSLVGVAAEPTLRARRLGRPGRGIGRRRTARRGRFQPVA